MAERTEEQTMKEAERLERLYVSTFPFLIQEDRTVRPYGNFKQVSAYTSGERVYLSSVSR
ncbi:hypothetical protein [Caniella muris]|uniref:hypothetical protein n=1 Tax=Caniella muris TaxID=2941502 RepID=UPI00203DCE07|nr:hypothetical protein [Caniella muris]